MHPLFIIPLQNLMTQAAFLLCLLLCYLIKILTNHSNITCSTTKVFTLQINLQVLAVTFEIVSFWPECLKISDLAALHQALFALLFYILSTELIASVDGADFKN